MGEIVKTLGADLVCSCISGILLWGIAFFKLNELITANMNNYLLFLTVVSSLGAFLLVNIIMLILCVGLKACNKIDWMSLDKLDMSEKYNEFKNLIAGVTNFIGILCLENVIVSVGFYCLSMDFIEYGSLHTIAFCLLCVVTATIYYWKVLIKYELYIFRAIAALLIVLFFGFLYAMPQYIVLQEPIYKEMYYTNENQINILLPMTKKYTIISPWGEKIKTNDVISKQMHIISIIDLTNDNCVAGTYKIKNEEAYEGSFKVIFAGTRKDKEEYFDKYVSMLRRDDFAAYEKNQELILRIKQCALDGDKASFDKIASRFDKNVKEDMSMALFMAKIKIDPTFCIMVP